MVCSLRKLLVMVFISQLLIGCAANFPAPVSGLNKDYNSIPRGSYRGSYYEVQKGDTLYFISYVTDKDVNDLIRFNNLSKPYTIRPGQKLKLWIPNYTPPAYGGNGVSETVAVAATTGAASSVSSAPISTVNSSKNSNDNKTYNATSQSTKVAKKDPPKVVDQSKSKEYVDSKGKQNINANVTSAKPKDEKVAKWLWPTKGRVIKNFSAGDQGNKGIDIAGQRGQPIVSTAAGTVVYSGNALRGYGNLVIVKHNDNYLSAYAHNDRLLVQEGQSVKAGQKIATMGSSGTSSVRLHFEIRYQGKSVNPKRYLP
ncbi:murein hydrolase activator NlpD [Vibrio aestuarianus]|uniref:murein hydrolase activator NlpD n=1 Tax=Vibrio aestuarianus TaxID=28171 RepID=UPI00237CC0D0|nr:murein hydrolase activator NlpD [Vibrio aestuarianus]MDE1315175.1 murein hydrolase activator NlpD [Vibrio aestuarianus]